VLGEITEDTKSVTELIASTSKVTDGMPATATATAPCTTTTTTITAVTTAPDDAAYEPPRKAAALASSTASINKLSQKKKKSNTTDDDSQLFNSWLSSEIQKNSVKIDLMRTEIEKNIAKKELIDLLKYKTSLEIQTLSNPSSVLNSVVFDPEN